jgi:hypothetical protein
MPKPYSQDLRDRVMALSRSPSIGTFWAISVRLRDKQIIDFARAGQPTSGAVDK